MKQFIIEPLHSVGDIKFGMERSKVREFLGSYAEYKNNQEDNNTADCFDVCHVFYDESNRVEFVMFHALDNVELKWGNRLLNRMTKDELLEYFSEIDANLTVEPDGESIESNKFGIACYFVTDICFDEEDNEEEFEKLETISVAIENYWSKI
jgi:hypothetical protein